MGGDDYFICNRSSCHELRTRKRETREEEKIDSWKSWNSGESTVTFSDNQISTYFRRQRRWSAKEKSSSWGYSHKWTFFSFQMQVLERTRMVAILSLTVVGCTGNLLTLIIINRHFFRKTASAPLISGLCIADCMFLCLQSIQLITKLRPHVTNHDCLLFFLMDVFHLFSLWIICFVNVERCSLVFNPCRVPRLTSPIKARILVGILFLFSLLVFSHYGWHMKISYDYAENSTIPIRSLCEFQPEFNLVTWEFIQSALTYWSVVPLCIVCNIIIIRRLYQASQIERSLHPESSSKMYLSSRQRQLTAMLVASSVCFVCTATPSTVHRIYLLISDDVSVHHYVLHVLTNILLHFHHASNFLAFAFSCSRFRVELIELLRMHLRCQFYSPWYKSSTPGTEQIVFNSNKQQRIPMKLLTPKSNTRRRSLPLQGPVGVIMAGNNPFPKRSGRAQAHPMRPYVR